MTIMTRIGSIRQLRHTTAWLCLACIILQAPLVAATVSYGPYTFESMPSHFGKTWFPPSRNVDARLQFLPENSKLCHGMGHEGLLALPGLVIPEENSTLPVALLVERGDCSFQDKANIAMKAFPAVSYMVVYDNEPSKNLVSMRESSSADNITLGMLFISYRGGMALRVALNNQTDEVNSAGGPIIQLNGLDPLMMHEPSLADLQTWILIAMSGFFCFIVVFGCILVFVQLGVIPVNGAGQIMLTQEAIRRSRRLLTREEVARLQVGGDLHGKVATTGSETTEAEVLEVETQPSGAEESSSPDLEGKGPTNPATIDNHSDDDGEEAGSPALVDPEAEEDHNCAVCLDDLVPCSAGGDEAVTTLCLPCRHNYHLDCIVPWLTERHATCPLCKFDVLQFIMDLDDKSSTKKSKIGNSFSWCKERASRLMRLGWSPVHSNDSQSGGSAAGLDEENERNNDDPGTATPI